MPLFQTSIRRQREVALLAGSAAHKPNGSSLAWQADSAVAAGEERRGICKEEGGLTGKTTFEGVEKRHLQGDRILTEKKERRRGFDRATRNSSRKNCRDS